MSGRGPGGKFGVVVNKASDSSRKMKLLCSYGGRIEFPSTGGVYGKPEYIDGDTHLVMLHDADIYWDDFRNKMSILCRYGSFTVKYYLPGEGLITLSSQDDFDNMLEEFQLLLNLEYGPIKPRIFLIEKDQSYGYDF